MLDTCCVFVGCLYMLVKRLDFCQCNAEMACTSTYAESGMFKAYKSNAQLR